MRIGIIQRTAIMRAQDKETHHHGIVLLEHLADSEKVAQAFGHLLVVHAHETVMYPVIHELPIATIIRLCTLAMRDLVFVVRELQVRAATVDVEMLAEQFGAHRRTFDMPAGPAFAPPRFPFYLFR